MTENEFVGAWKLVSFELIGEDGKKSTPYGPDARGYIFYLADGYMSVSFMRAGRPPFQTQDPLGGSEAEKAGAMGSFFSYCGRYEIQGNEVVHHMEVSWFPNWSGKDLRRFYQFEGRRLALRSAPQLFQGKMQTIVIVWERA